MAGLTVRNVYDLTKQTLRMRAARHAVAMEEEARRLVKEALATSDEQAMLGRRLLDRFAGASSDDLVLPDRRPLRS